MQTSWSPLFTRVAKVLMRLSTRPKSTGRPSAPLGSRILTDPDDVFKHNMWDHVQWTEEDKENARQKAADNSCVRIPADEQGKYNTEAVQYWDSFYEAHQDKFFKNRTWLFQEFPELLPRGAHSSDANGCQNGEPSSCGSSSDAETRIHQHNSISKQRRNEDPSDCQQEDYAQTLTFPGQNTPLRILEVGCGVGNSVFPIVKSIKETGSYLYCCDFSPRAIQMVKEHPEYDRSVCHAFVHDLCEEMASFPFPPQSLDVILAVFVLSSIHPERMQGVVNRLSACLKHGGTFLFRDYGRYDLAQLRFKKGRCLSENFYVRGDGTCVYFFTKEEIHTLFTNAGLEEIQNLEDRRLQVNRGKKVAMQRVWMQSKYRKPLPS